MNELALANDAGRSAIAALKAMRNGDPESAMLLVARMDESEQGGLQWCVPRHRIGSTVHL